MQCCGECGVVLFTLDFGSGLMLGPAQSELLLGRGSSHTAGRCPGEGVVVVADVQTNGRTDIDLMVNATKNLAGASELQFYALHWNNIMVQIFWRMVGYCNLMVVI